jgi:signal transduction histidine kinase
MDGQEGGIPHDTLLSSLEDSRGRLWFGFVSGLARYDSQQDTFHTFLHERGNTQSLSNNVVLFLLEDSHSRMWVGTTGGLNRIEEHEDGSVTFVRFGKRQGLPDTFVSSIVEAGDDLWLGTEKGVVRFRENNGVVDARLYDMSDGLQVTSYTHDAVYRDQNGRMYFGGEGGVDVFHPDLIRGDEIPPRVVLTDLQIFNRPVSIARDERMDGTLSVDRAIAFLSELRLTHRHSVLTFHYSALHYRQPDRIRYAYMLDGFDRNWIDADTKTEATYTNLDPGDYTFRVKAMNADGVWSIQPAELALHVEPPPWRTWWAHSLYAIAGAGAIAAFTRSRIAARERELREQQRMEQARLEERESIRRQNASDFHDEAGTTLTRILFLTELARRSSNGDDELRTLLEKIDANATRLSQGMRDFIWVLDPDKDTLLDTLQRIATFGEALFAHSEATFTMQYDHQLLRGVKLDLNERRQVLMICKEALHNAARHAGAMSVMVRVRYSNDLLIITIEDDGCGFDALNGNSGYGMKSMRTRAAGVGAVLNLESLPHQGTSVELRLPQMSD